MPRIFQAPSFKFPTRSQLLPVLLALCMLPVAGAAAQHAEAEAKPKAGQPGVFSQILGNQSGKGPEVSLPPEFSESKMVCGILGMLLRKEYGAAGESKAAVLTGRLQQAYTEMAKDPAFKEIPCALAPALAGNAAPPSHYYLYVPDSYKAGQEASLLLFLHGGGGNFLGGFYMSVKDLQKSNTILVCPTFRNGDWWTDEGHAFALKVLEEVCSRYTINKKAIVIGGVSNGATGAWKIAQRTKETFSAVIAISGAFDGAKPVAASPGPPLFIAHGALDTIIPVALSRNAFAALKERKGTVYKEFPDAGHLVSLEKPELSLSACLDWMQKLPGTAPLAASVPPGKGAGAEGKGAGNP